MKSVQNLNKILIIIASLSILALAVVAVIIRGFTTSKQNIADPTLYPTQEAKVRPTLSQEEVEEYKKEEAKINSRVLSDDQITRYDSFTGSLPFSSNDFEVVSSFGLSRVFIQFKNPQAETKVRAYLQQNNVLDIYDQFPELFVVTDQPIEKAIQQAQEDYAREREESQSQ